MPGIRAMATQHLTLRRCSDGYWRTSWVDDQGGRHGRSFGRARVAALNDFAEFHSRWKADFHVRNPDAAAPVSVRDLWERFEAWGRGHYVHPDGRPTGELVQCAAAVRELLAGYGDAPARSVGPLVLQEIRQRMVAADLARTTVNARLNRIRRVFRWGVSQELVPAAVLTALESVLPLQQGRDGVREAEPVRAVPDAHVWAVCAVLPASLRAMVEVQYWSGCRPQDVCRLRPCDLDLSGAVWIYAPTAHKTSWRGLRRTICLGPHAQEALRPYLSRALTAWCFSPREAVTQRNAARELHRHQAVAEPITGRRVGDQWTTQSYGRAIAYACEEAAVPRWSPNQLRHNALSRIRRQFGREAARLVGGHTDARVTDVYTEQEWQRVREIAEEVG